MIGNTDPLMFAPNVIPSEPRTSFLGALRIQLRVIGALLMRELHTRYGRENIGYLWLIGEPLMLGTVIALLHRGSSRSVDIDPVAFGVVGYSIFIMFRGIVNRSDAAILSNAPLLYHRMVTVLDFTLARSLLEAAGTFMAFLILFGCCVILGYTYLPPRPLLVFLGICYIFWVSLAVSMVITGGTYEHPLLERFVHPFTYFMIPLSGAFYQVAWVPEPYRTYLLYNPLPQAFELIRFGAFNGTNLDFVDFRYMTGFCMVVTLWGLLAMRSVRHRIHLK